MTWAETTDFDAKICQESSWRLSPWIAFISWYKAAKSFKAWNLKAFPHCGNTVNKKRGYCLELARSSCRVIRCDKHGYLTMFHQWWWKNYPPTPNVPGIHLPGVLIGSESAPDVDDPKTRTTPPCSAGAGRKAQSIERPHWGVLRTWGSCWKIWRTEDVGRPFHNVIGSFEGLINQPFQLAVAGGSMQPSRKAKIRR